jgi:hypothetical protein
VLFYSTPQISSIDDPFLFILSFSYKGETILKFYQWRKKTIFMANKPMSRKSDIVIQEIDNEILIYDLITNNAFCLNETSAIIWRLCDGTKTVSEISRAAAQKLNAVVSEDLVGLALEQFKKDQLICDEFKSVFEGMTRREMVRKVGFASMVALPVVASIIAPISTNAQSCIPFDSSCTLSTTGGGCCPMSFCATTPTGDICTCMCVNPGGCLTQTGCPSTNNCNPSGVCAP